MVARALLCAFPTDLNNSIWTAHVSQTSEAKMAPSPPCFGAKIFDFRSFTMPISTPINTPLHFGFTCLADVRCRYYSGQWLFRKYVTDLLTSTSLQRSIIDAGYATGGRKNLSWGPSDITLYMLNNSCLLCISVFRFTGYPGQDIKVNRVSFQHICVKQFFSLSDVEQLDLIYLVFALYIAFIAKCWYRHGHQSSSTYIP